MGGLGAPEIIVIAVVVLLLFGAAKLPIFARSLGQSLRIFKTEMKEAGRDSKTEAAPAVVAEERKGLPAQPVTAQPVVTEPAPGAEARPDTRA